MLASLVKDYGEEAMVFIVQASNIIGHADGAPAIDLPEKPEVVPEKSVDIPVSTGEEAKL